MTLDDIPADKTLTMTKLRDRLFQAADCNPTCHYCNNPIVVGEKFRLATWKNNDVMLCPDCTIADLDNKRAVGEAARAAYREQHFRQYGRYPGYFRPHRSAT